MPPEWTFEQQPATAERRVKSFPATYAYDAEQLRPSPLNFSPRHAKNVARSRIDGTMDSFDSTLGGALLSMVAAEKAADEREAARKAADALAAEVEFRKAQAKEEAKAARAAARADRQAEGVARGIARAAVDTVQAEEDAIVAAEQAAVEQAAAEAAAAEAAVVAAQKAAEEEAAAMKAALIEAEAKAKAKADAEAKAVQRKAELKLKLKRCLWREWTRPQFDVAFDAGEEKTAARLGRFSERDLHIFNKAIDLVPRLMDAYKSAHAQKRAQDAFEAMMEQEDPELRPATRAKPPAGLGLVCRRFIINVPTGGRGIASGRGWSIRNSIHRKKVAIPEREDRKWYPRRRLGLSSDWVNWLQLGPWTVCVVREDVVHREPSVRMLRPPRKN